MTINLAVDIGGSFTDVALLKNGKLYSAKSVTTTASPDKGVMNAIDDAFRASGLSYGEVDRFILGTTLATNALIERKGARTALVTTQGFADIVEFARENRYAQYDINMRRAPVLVPRRLRFGVPERMDHRGRPVLGLDERACRRLADTLAGEGIRSVAVCFLHSYANDAHERRAREILLECDPSLSVSISAEICPEIREYERVSTVCANAYVQPIIAGALDALEAALKARGLRCPVFLMTSSGALCSVEVGKREPVRLVESGPAGGAIFAAHVARQCGLDRMIEFDMGGTTAKMSYVMGFQPMESRNFEFDRAYRFLKGSGQPIRVPVIEMVEIGAGGGSVAHRDGLGRLRVGPHSVVADPGPVCFARGGVEPTVTDSNCVLNYLDPERFAGGKIRLDAQAAAGAMQERLGRELGLSRAEEVAAMISEVVTENMASAARVHGIELGHDIGRCAAVAIGGGGPLHIGRIARKLGIRKFVIPAEASVGSAVGFLVAPIQYGTVKSVSLRLESIDVGEVRRTLEAMSRAAAGEVRRMLGGGQADVSASLGAYMCYRGQGHEIKVDLDGLEIGADFPARARAAFERVYESLYHRTLPELGVDIVTWAVTAGSRASPADVLELSDVDPSARNQSRERAVFLAEQAGSMAWTTVRDYQRNTLEPGFSFDGPAIVSERHTTTVVPSGFRATVDPHRHLIVEEA
ncbi:hydantoinase/oxoprolinase family protein [Pigmentiphaga soli]|uniref:Hydantoinase/oxoprolinase family protein n=1 Tax=Pigmentiphaga soli TaxID=1007095 RepID=A0ABP8GF57_9BURK